MPVPITPLISIVANLLISLIKMAREVKEMSDKDYEEWKEKFDEEFKEENFPTAKELEKKVRGENL